MSLQQWVTSPGAAFGIELAADPSGSAALMIDSRENTATSFATEVRVVLSGPAGLPALAAVCALYFCNGIAAPAGMECPKLIFATQSSFMEISAGLLELTIFATASLRRLGIRGGV